MKRFSKLIFLLVALIILEKETTNVVSVNVEIKWDTFYPNTKWCGSGTYPSDGSLGEDECTDACCKAHAQCPLQIKPDEVVHNLLNTYDYTVSSCDCEAAFRTCLLKNINESTNEDSSRAVGQIYFTALGMDCPKEDYPIVQCLSETTIGNRCKQYKLDMNQPKKWQWFDVLPFDLE